MMPEYIGRYKLHTFLGQGGMGTVYRAYDPLIDRWVALKTIPIQDDRQKARFQQEVQAAGRLNHPQIVTVYDVGLLADQAYIVMELIEGGTLVSERVVPLPWQEAVRLIVPIGQALAYAHRQGVIHRDVKPSNILISRQGDVKLTDFGVARLNRTPGITSTGGVTGTPLYAAPEQVRSEATDGRADLFALGLILYELIVGQHPFEETNLAQLIYRLTQPDPVNLAALVPLAPQSLVAILGRLLEKVPDNRFPDAETVTEALEACLAEAPTEAPAGAEAAKTPLPRLVYAPSDLSLPPVEEALLRVAFAGHDQLYLEQTFKGGYSGAKVILATPIRSGRRLSKIVLKFDNRAAIEREWHAYQTFVGDILPSTAARITNPPVYAPDGSRAVLWYTYVGELGEAVPESLYTYYLGHTGPEVATLIEQAVFQPFGEQWWLHRASATFTIRQEYDHYLPVHLRIRPNSDEPITAEPPPDEASGQVSAAAVLVAGQVNSHHFQGLRPNQPVRLEGFTLTEVAPDQTSLQLQTLPVEGSPPYPIRVQVIDLPPALLDRLDDRLGGHHLGDALPVFNGTVVATRHDLLKGYVQPGFPDQDLSQKTLTLDGADYPNPLFDYDLLLDHLLITMQSIIHGDLNLENILVTPRLNLAWLIDFATTREGHVLADFLRLETQVITKLLPLTNIKPAGVAQLLQALPDHTTFPPHLPAELEKPFLVLATIRHKATGCLHDRQTWDEYYLGLVMMLLGALKFGEMDTRARQFIFIAAATVRGLIETAPLRITDVRPSAPPRRPPNPAHPRG